VRAVRDAWLHCDVVHTKARLVDSATPRISATHQLISTVTYGRIAKFRWLTSRPRRAEYVPKRVTP